MSLTCYEKIAHFLTKMLRENCCREIYAYSGLILPDEFRRRSVCPLVTSVYCEKMANSIEMPSGMVTGPRNDVLDVGPDPHGKRQFFGGARM